VSSFAGLKNRLNALSLRGKFRIVTLERAEQKSDPGGDGDTDPAADTGGVDGVLELGGESSAGGLQQSLEAQPH